MKVTFRNNHPTKTITALKIEAALWDAFGERLTYYDNGYPNFRGYADDRYLRPGESVTLYWALNQPHPKTAIVYVYQIQYSDGTGWKVDID